VKVTTLEELREAITVSVEEAANLVGLSRTKGYEMVKNGDLFEVIQSGSRVRVLARPLYIRLLGSAVDGVQS
jgi:excisionase family DNA binding protein